MDTPQKRPQSAFSIWNVSLPCSPTSDDGDVPPPQAATTTTKGSGRRKAKAVRFIMPARFATPAPAAETPRSRATGPRSREHRITWLHAGPDVARSTYAEGRDTLPTR
jgi:hypothetical protein